MKQKDRTIDAKKLEDQNPYHCIIYEIMKYDLLTKKVDEKFGFAVQPLMTNFRD
jgi:hypothetical protein